MTAQNHINENAIKRPQDDVPLTPEEEDLWMEYADDPFKFFTEVCYVRGTRGKVLFDPRDYQKDLMDVILDNSHSVALAPRQSGKCCHQDSVVQIRVDGVEQEMTIGDLHELIKNRT